MQVKHLPDHAPQQPPLVACRGVVGSSDHVEESSTCRVGLHFWFLGPKVGYKNSISKLANIIWSEIWVQGG